MCDLPVRAAKFVPRKNWVVTGSDDMQIRIFNYNTLERIHNFEAHSDYVRCIVVHPTQPYILTSSGKRICILLNCNCFLSINRRKNRVHWIFFSYIFFCVIITMDVVKVTFSKLFTSKIITVIQCKMMYLNFDKKVLFYLFSLEPRI